MLSSARRDQPMSPLPPSSDSAHTASLIPRAPYRALGAAALVLAWLSCPLPVRAAGEAFETPAVTAEDLEIQQRDPNSWLVVDVRPLGEYKAGHVAGAINIPYDKIDGHLEELRAAGNGVVLYCTMGTRTRLAEQTLLDNDVGNVFHLEGGLGAWMQGGYPIHTGWGP